MTANEGVRATEEDRCLLCGATGERFYSDLRDRLFSAPGSWAFLACPNCRLVWLNPRPVAEDIGKLYASYYTHSVEPAASFRRLRQEVREGILGAAFGYAAPNGGIASWVGAGLSRIPAVRDRVGMGIGYLRSTRQNRLLDVGCGSGVFLSRMRALGWEVTGVEPDPAAAARGRDEFGLSILTGGLEDAAFPDGSFDAVTVNHVIEHVLDPVRLLRACWRVVALHGRLIVITPNVASLAHKIHRAAWYCLDPPRHLFLFSRDTLTLCAERAAIPVNHLRTSSRLAPHTWSASRVIAATGEGPPQREPTRVMTLEGGAFQAVEECALLFDRYAGEELLLIASKEVA